MRLDGKVALISGGARGMGAAEAKLFINEGAKVVIGDILEEEGKQIEAMINESGGECLFTYLDVTSEASWNETVNTTINKFGKLDILVNNAGTSVPMGFLKADAETLDLMLNLNVRAAFLVAQGAARIMDCHGGGVIIHLSSTFGKVGRPGFSIYSGTKHFIDGLTKSTAVELAPRNIRVVAVGPTAIATPMMKDRLADPEVAAELTSRIPMGRIGKIEDVVGAVVFLASPAAALITGTTIMVDGGWTAP